MKVYFDNVNFSSSTGPNTFAHRLASELVENFGVEIVGKKDFHDIFLCFIEPTVQPTPESSFCQRLDGIWFKPDQFDTHNKLIKWAYKNSDAVIWQSEFDKNMTQHHWGDRFGRVIGNGIKINQVKKSQEFSSWRKSFDKLFVSSASWHRQKRLKENIELFQRLSSNLDALVILGNNPDYIVESPNIFYCGQKSHQSCLEIYSAANWMIHLAWLDHCPNVVVEALSQNCPVICTDSGGTKEIVRGNGIILPETRSYRYQLTDYDNPPALDLDSVLLKDTPVYNSYLEINKVASQYMSLFKSLRERR